MSNAYIEMHVANPERVEILIQFVARLREAKLSGSFPPDDEWETHFDGPARSYFKEWTPGEMKEWENDWKAAPAEVRHKDMSLWPHWDFGSFLDALKAGEFLISGVVLSGKVAKLQFEPLAYPYGGPDCLIAIVEAFGQEPVGYDDGAGYQRYEKQARWLPRAKRKAT